MTREEEIRRVSNSYTFDSTDTAFMLGANWADTHPIGYDVMLDKACQWLKEHTHDQEHGWDDSGKAFMVLPTMDAYQAQFIKNFRKAMEE